MAKIYASRNLLDPNMLSLARQAMNDRITQDRDSRRRMVDAITGAVGKTGELFDDWAKRQYEEDLGRQRYAYLKRVTPSEYMTDPMYKAAMHEFARTGSSAPLSVYMLGKETRDANRIAKAEQDAEKNRSAWRDFSLGMDAAQETYAKRQQEMLKALDEGRNQDAEIARKAMEALEKKYTRGEGDSPYGDLDTREVGVSPFGDTAEAITEARLAERKAREEAEAAEQARLLKATAFEAGLPTTYKDADAMKATIDSILNNPDLTDPEKTEMIKKVMGKGNTKGKLGEAFQTSGINTAVKDSEEEKQRVKNVKALAKKAKEKKDKGYDLLKSEQDAFDEATKNGWI